MPDPGGDGSYAVNSISLTLTNPANGHSLPTDIYFPAYNGAVDPGGAPYATLVFARGFLSSTSNYNGNGRHLASWGYIVVLVDFPSEDTEARATDTRYVFTYLETQNAEVGGPFYTRIDTDRFGVLGHSLGGLTALMVTSRDARVKAAVALDPVDPPATVNTPWDYQLEGPNISVATAIVGAPSQMCNLSANYNAIYPHIGADHKALWVLTNGNHCDFVHTTNSLERAACYYLCGGTYDAGRVTLIERYTTAWFNYYLRGQTEYYSYLYGAAAQADIAAGRVTRQVDTSPRGVTAQGQVGAINLAWDLSSNPLVAGYNIYRATVSGGYPVSPAYQTDRTSSFRDEMVIPGQRYFYELVSRDPAGNEHQRSTEVSATAAAPVGGTPTSTPTPTATVVPRKIWLPMLLVASGSLSCITGAAEMPSCPRGAVR